MRGGAGPRLGVRVGRPQLGAGNEALALYLKDQDVAVVVLANQTGTPTDRLTAAVLEVVLGDPPG